MTNYRQDDIPDFIRDVEREASGNKRAKILQTWIGEVAVKVPHDFKATPEEGKGPLAQVLARRIVRHSSKNWSWTLKSFGDRWLLLDGSYRVKGANAYDAEKVIKGLGIPDSHIAIRTKIVIPETSFPGTSR